MIDWQKVREFVHTRTMFCSVAVVDEGKLRTFPIGSLRIKPDGRATYFELFARPVPEGAEVSFLAVDMSLWFWLKSLVLGRFLHPPALRMYGTLGKRRACTEAEKQGWQHQVRWLLKTRGGSALWAKPGPIRELQFKEVEAVRLGKMTSHLEGWLG